MALGSRTPLRYVNRADHRGDGIVVYYREERTDGEGAGEVLIVVLNFSDEDRWVEVEFPYPGTWRDLIEAGAPDAISQPIARAGDIHRVRITSNYGAILSPS